MLRVYIAFQNEKLNDFNQWPKDLQPILVSI